MPIDDIADASVTNPFPAQIRHLPLADIPLPGVTAYLSQAATHQTLYMHFEETVVLTEHSHADLVIGGQPAWLQIWSVSLQPQR